MFAFTQRQKEFKLRLLFQNVALSVLALIPCKWKGEEYGKANKASALYNPVDVELAGWMKTDKIAKA